MKNTLLIIIVLFFCSIASAQVSYVIDSAGVSTYCDDVFFEPVIRINGRLFNESNNDEFLSIRYGNTNDVAQSKITIWTDYGQKKSETPYVAPNGLGNYLPEYNVNFAGFRLFYSVLRAGQQQLFPMSSYFAEIEGQFSREDIKGILSTLHVDVSPDINDSVAFDRITALLPSTLWQEEYEVCPMYRIRDLELLQFINEKITNGLESGFCTIQPSSVGDICVLKINIYATSLFSRKDLRCLKKCCGGIEGTEIPSFLVGRPVPSVFEKTQDSELSETWSLFKKMVKDRQYKFKKEETVGQKTSVVYRTIY